MSHSDSVSRRAFVGRSALGVVGLSTLGERLSHWRPEDHERVGEAASRSAAFELEEATIADLQSAMSSGRYTARSLVEQYLARIDSLDQKGPSLNHIVELNPDALAIADQLDTERKAGKTRGPLHGIPVLIKDNIDTADRMHTSAGSLALANHIAARDSFVAERLRAAGAIILGKTSLSEWANFRSTHSTSGWCGRVGQGKNPYALDRNTSGSSSGSGGACAASYCTIAIGTETDGSVTSPSAAQSLVGIKPTVGLIGRSGIVPIAHSQDTAGPMTRTVRDAAILLGALTGMDPRDPATNASRGHAQTDYTSFLDENGLRGARIGVIRERYMGYSPKTDALVATALDVMKQRGATIVDPANLATVGKYEDAEFEVLLYEFKADLNAYLQGVAPNVPVHSLADVIAFNLRNASTEMPYFGQEIMEQAQKKGPLTDPKYRAALAKAKRMSGPQGIDATMTKHKLDALIAPTQAAVWLTDLVNGDPGGFNVFSGPAAVAGYPHITVPMGFVQGLPVGLSFVGGAWSEPTLLKLAYAFEQATKARRKPEFRSTAELKA